MAAWHTDADLFHQWEEAEERAEKWLVICQDLAQNKVRCFRES